MSKKDITAKSDQDLDTFIVEKRDEIQAERFKDAQSRKGSVIKNGRRDIARALTEKNARLTKANQDAA